MGRVCSRQRAICGSFYSRHKNRSFESTKCRESGGGCSARASCIPRASGAPSSASDELKSIETTKGGEAKHKAGQSITKADGKPF